MTLLSMLLVANYIDIPNSVHGLQTTTFLLSCL